jgi:sialate O-acetylesterase
MFRTKLLALLLMLLPVARAEVKLPTVFTDHMVLQRDLPVPVWGTASPGESVTVEFAGQKKVGLADAAGKWKVQLDPLKASAESKDLRAGTLVIHDVLVGEVWLASGQSNMAFGLNAAHNAAEVLPQVNDPQLRFFTVVHKTAAEPQADLQGKWELANPPHAELPGCDSAQFVGRYTD